MHFTRKKRGFLVQGYQDVWKLTNDSQYNPQNMFFYTLGTYHESSLISFPLFYQITLEKYSFIHMYRNSSNIHPFEFYLEPFELKEGIFEIGNFHIGFNEKINDTLDKNKKYTGMCKVNPVNKMGMQLE